MDDKTKNKLYNEWVHYIHNKLWNLLPALNHDQNISIEGNIYTRHLIKIPDEKHKSKQINFFNLFEKYKFYNILEIGFNSGFSSVLMSILAPEAKITSVDICIHDYVETCFNVIQKDFPNIDLLKGDSTVVLPELIKQSKKYDLIHLDGCHLPHIAKKDLDNSLELLANNGIIIFDDTQDPDLSILCKQYVVNNKMKKLDFAKNVIDTNWSDHDFFTK